MEDDDASPRVVSTGWLSPDESAFLENTITDRKLFRYLYTRENVKIKYPARYAGSYQEYASSVALEFQRAHQTLRRLMNKSPYTLGNGQRAYTVIEDEQIPLKDLNVGSRVTLGYRLLLMRPKYDIGKHSSLVELVFPVNVKILPVGTSHYIMDEDHVFELTGFERRGLNEHPSHGTAYHIDLIRMVATGDYRVPTTIEKEEDEHRRVHIVLDETEKPNLMISASNWTPESTAAKIVRRAHGPPKEIVLKEFEEFRRALASIAARFSEETLTALFRVSEQKRSLVTKLLFEVHSHTLKISHVVAEFTAARAVDTRYGDLERMVSDSAAGISRELDTYFQDQSSVSATAATIYLMVSAKHVEQLGDAVGTMIQFDNYLVGYTSTDSISERVGERPGHVILALQIPPRMPILILPEHTKISKLHRAVVLPRDTVFQLEEIRSMLVLAQPRTYRKVFSLRFRREERPPSTATRTPLGEKLSETHLLQLEPEMQSSVARKV